MANKPKKISELDTGNYEADKGKAFLPASIGTEQTRKYPLGAIEESVKKEVAGKYLPNTTSSAESTGVTDSASVDIGNMARLEMREGAVLKMRGGTTIEIQEGAVLKMRGGTTIEIQDGARMYLREGAYINIGTANLDIAGSAQIYIKEEARVYVAEGASISLGGASRVSVYNNSNVYVFGGQIRVTDVYVEVTNQANVIVSDADTLLKVKTSGQIQVETNGQITVKNSGRIKVEGNDSQLSITNGGIIDVTDTGVVLAEDGRIFVNNKGDITAVDGGGIRAESNGNFQIKNNGRAYISDNNSYLGVEGGASLLVTDKGLVNVRDSGEILVSKKGIIKVEGDERDTGTFLNITSGGAVSVEADGQVGALNGGILIANNGGVLNINNNAHAYMRDNSLLEMIGGIIKSTGHVEFKYNLVNTEYAAAVQGAINPWSMSYMIMQSADGLRAGIIAFSSCITTNTGEIEGMSFRIGERASKSVGFSFPAGWKRVIYKEELERAVDDLKDRIMSSCDAVVSLVTTWSKVTYNGLNTNGTYSSSQIEGYYNSKLKLMLIDFAVVCNGSAVPENSVLVNIASNYRHSADPNKVLRVPCVIYAYNAITDRVEGAVSAGVLFIRNGQIITPQAIAKDRTVSASFSYRVA